MEQEYKHMHINRRAHNLFFGKDFRINMLEKAEYLYADDSLCVKVHMTKPGRLLCVIRLLLTHPKQTIKARISGKEWINDDVTKARVWETSYNDDGTEDVNCVHNMFRLYAKCVNDIDW